VIVAVCLNPAIDVTYRVAEVRPGSSHRVEEVHRRPGGKGVNVARVLAQLGTPVTLCGFAGGGTGQWLRAALAGTPSPAGVTSPGGVVSPGGVASLAGVIDRLTVVDGDTRQTVTVVDSADATVFNEPGPVVTAADWDRLLAAFDLAVAGAEVAVMSGSLPPGAPGDAYALLVRAATRHNVPTIVDTAGEGLLRAADAGATILAPNRAEVGLPSGDQSSLLAAAFALSRRSGGTTVISAGSDGLVAAGNGRSWTARPPRLVAGNPTGAGDALSAGLARGLATDAPLPAMLADALALAAAAVAAPVAGQVDEDLYRELSAQSTVQEVAPCP
jgi:tagatose 6-phosphate kinase